MKRCDRHGHFGCADYECQRAETVRAGGPTIEYDNSTPLAPAQVDASNTGDEPEPILTAEQWAACRNDDEEGR